MSVAISPENRSVLMENISWSTFEALLADRVALPSSSQFRSIPTDIPVMVTGPGGRIRL